MNQYEISFRITHPEMRDTEISEGLALAPAFSYSAGDRKETPKGNLLPGLRAESYWYCDVERADCLEEALSRFCRDIKRRREFLHDIAQSGGRLELFVGWFALKNYGFVLQTELLGEIVDLGISLSFDIYSGDK